MKNREVENFVAYEYLSLEVKDEKEPLYTDCYENFGWNLVRNTTLIDREDYYINQGKAHYKKCVNIRFKRDRRIQNKADLNSLQRKMERSLKQIEKLEKEPQQVGMIYSLSVSIVGTIFLALATFAVTATSLYMIACILFGSIGLIGWILPYFIYTRVKMKKEQANTLLIEEEYNVVYDSCSEARKLIDKRN